MNLVVLRRDAELLRAAPSEGTHVSVFLIVLFQDETLGGVDLCDAVRNFKVHQCCRTLEPFGMLGALENLAAIGALAFEHGAGVMQTVGEHVDLAIGGGNELAVEPDQVRTLVEGHRHGIASQGMDGPLRAEFLPRVFWAFCARRGLLRREATPGMVAVALSKRPSAPGQPRAVGEPGTMLP